MQATAALVPNPDCELAERVLLPGDPQRALAMSQSLLVEPRMFNHNRGLWGYTGTAPDGDPLTIQSSGIGGPSAAIVVEELVDLGTRTLIRVGTCGVLTTGPELGSLFVATAAIAADGTSVALGAERLVRPDHELTEALGRAVEATGTGRSGVVATTDLFYDDRTDVAQRWLDEGALAVEMEAATVLQVAKRRKVAAGCVLAVTDLLEGGDAREGRTRLDNEGIAAAGMRAGEAALGALCGDRPGAGGQAAGGGSAA